MPAVWATDLKEFKFSLGYVVRRLLYSFCKKLTPPYKLKRIGKRIGGVGSLFFSHGTSNSRGVCILFKDISDITVEKEYHDDEGRFIILDVVLNKQKLTFINVYDPNVDNYQFFDNILQHLNMNFDCESVVWGGDFNLILDVTIDKKGGLPQITHSHSLNCINMIMNEYNLVDIWRLNNPTVKMFTWHSRYVFCRLDFFLVSHNLVTQIDECNILPGFKTDHSAISLNLYSIQEIRGRGFWKFNTSLLQDETYAELVRTCIKENKSNFYDALDPNTFWDFLKCQM